jgi:hypothetical protein
VDALYALTLDEVREAGVDAISDGAFDGGAPLSCGPAGCFETGELWTWVWTRDTAYAIDLGLGAHDAARARQLPRVQAVERKSDDGDLQVVQDTGSGGSWPVSSDRVVWALGARRLLGELPGRGPRRLRHRARQALSNTIEQDRVVVFDPAFGLYRGEQSFLDWREQSYPDFTRDDVATIAMGFALGTNLLHLSAIELVRDLALEQGDDADASATATWRRPARRHPGALLRSTMSMACSRPSSRRARPGAGAALRYAVVVAGGAARRGDADGGARHPRPLRHTTGPAYR